MKTLIANTFDDFKAALVNSPELQTKFKESPVDALEGIVTQNPKDTDSWIYRIIVIALGLAILTIIITLTIMVIRLENKDALSPQIITIFTAISSGAIGALAGLLAPSPNKQ
ncbi:hypothetical protein [Chryseobacterium pennipullorum]|uniref:Uncharacterized protein n=1 Tax=Chryseobacterium pennipullorum TaxID=2258963 RepID=A0A3D9B6X8_9FLAO|nr:hypothetical protein [Chryseobacterium pennipullorum]REC49118.1 hypothetical protein DRF67_06085 [Chryseobacterium pennipullorum]